jgi:hypothetical protein
MKKNLAVPLIIVLLLSMMLAASPALARSEGGRIAGRITTLDADAGTITIQPRQGEPVTIQTTEATRFLRNVPPAVPEPITFADLVVNMSITAVGAWEDGVFYATVVMVMPPPPPPEAAVTGEIEALDAGAGTIVVQPRGGDPVTVQTTAETRFFRQVQPIGLVPITFDDLAVGDKITAKGTREDNLLTATQVIVLPPPPPPPPPPAQRLGGIITALDPDAGTIVVQRREGEPATIQTTADTEFLRQVPNTEPAPITFADLALRMTITASGAWQGDLFAADVVVVMPATPPPPAEHLGGVIIALDAGAGTITLKRLNREPVTVQTSADTEFLRRLPNGKVQMITFADLAKGLQITVEGAWEGEVFNASQVVVAGRLSAPPSAGDNTLRLGF